jgi:hypothetical protein
MLYIYIFCYLIKFMFSRCHVTCSRDNNNKSMPTRFNNNHDNSNWNGNSINNVHNDHNDHNHNHRHVARHLTTRRNWGVFFFLSIILLIVSIRSYLALLTAKGAQDVSPAPHTHFFMPHQVTQAPAMSHVATPAMSHVATPTTSTRQHQHVKRQHISAHDHYHHYHSAQRQ